MRGQTCQFATKPSRPSQTHYSACHSIHAVKMARPVVIFILIAVCMCTLPNSLEGVRTAAVSANRLRRSLAFFLGSKIALSFLTKQQRCFLNSLEPGDILVDQSLSQQDDIKMVLSLLGINSTAIFVDGNQTTHKTFRRALSSGACQSVFIHSGSPLVYDDVTVRRLRRFVARGGVLVTTDRAVTLADNVDFVQPTWKLVGRPGPHAPNNVNLEVRLSNATSGTQCAQGTRYVAKITSQLDVWLRGMRTVPRWNLLGSSRLARFRTTSNGTAAVVLSLGGLPKRLATLLACADVGDGQYYHVVGPLAQQIPPGAPGVRVHEGMINWLQTNAQLSFTQRDWDIIRPFLRLHTGLSIEDVSTTSISSAMVLDFILQSQTNRKCREARRLHRCFDSPDSARASEMELDISATSSTSPDAATTTPIPEGFTTESPTLELLSVVNDGNPEQ